MPHIKAHENIEKRLLIVEDEKSIQDIYGGFFDMLIGRDHYLIVDNVFMAKSLFPVFDTLVCDGEFHRCMNRLKDGCGVRLIESFSKFRAKEHPQKYGDAKKYDGIWLVSGNDSKVNRARENGYHACNKPIPVTFYQEVAHYMKTGEMTALPQSLKTK